MVDHHRLAGGGPHGRPLRGHLSAAALGPVQQRGAGTDRRRCRLDRRRRLQPAAVLRARRRRQR